MNVASIFATHSTLRARSKGTRLLSAWSPLPAIRVEDCPDESFHRLYGVNSASFTRRVLMRRQAMQSGNETSCNSIVGKYDPSPEDASSRATVNASRQSLLPVTRAWNGCCAFELVLDYHACKHEAVASWWRNLVWYISRPHNGGIGLHYAKVPHQLSADVSRALG